MVCYLDVVFISRRDNPSPMYFTSFSAYQNPQLELVPGVTQRYISLVQHLQGCIPVPWVAIDGQPKILDVNFVEEWVCLSSFSVLTTASNSVSHERQC